MIRLLALLCIFATPLWAVEPEEMLADPTQEARARALSTELRCPVCRNESIDESNAVLAKELRIILRERIAGGDSDEQAVDYLVKRYGEFILLNPPVTGSSWLLWGAAPALFLIALAIGAGVVRRKPTGEDDDLNADEKRRLERILQE